MPIEMEAYLPAAKALQQDVPNEHALDQLLMQGFSLKAVKGLEALGLTEAEIAFYVAHPEKEPLSSEDSKGALRAAYIVLRADAVFKTHEKALTWFRESNERLDNRAPVAVAHSEAGVGHVDGLLVRVEEGEAV